MKLPFIVTSVFFTSGGIVSAPIVNNINNNVNYSIGTPSKTELSIQNIPELSSITKLQQDNKISELTVESIDNFVSPPTTLNTYFSSKIYANYSSEKSDIVVNGHQIENQHKHLTDIYKDQIKLSNEKQTYTEVQTHLTSNTPTKSSWEMVEETSGSHNCKIQKSTAPKVPPTPVDPCSYDWNIMTISLEKKIKNLLEGATSPTTPTNLVTKFNALSSSAP